MERFSQFIRLKNSLSTRLLRVVFSSYFLVAVTMTVVHVAFEYSRTEAMIGENLFVFNQTFNQTIANSVWNMDERQLHATLNGMLALPDISGLSFVSTDNTEEKIVLGRVPSLQKEGVFDLNEQIFSRTFPVLYKSDDGANVWQVGDLTLYFDRYNVWRKIEGSFWLILLSGVLKAGVLAIVFILAFRRFLAEPLFAFTQRLNNLKLHEPSKLEPLAMPHLSAELRFMDDAFLKMNRRIREFAEENNRLNDNLFDLNKDLENRVHLRTQQLHETQRKLLREAHAAGMNQVTTEILHNVGNTVNSIGLSINAMKESFTEAEFKQFTEVMRILEQKVLRKDFSNLEEIIEFITVFGSKTQRDMDALKQVLDSMHKFVGHLRHITEVRRLQLPDISYETEINIDLFLQDSLYLAGLVDQTEIQVRIHPDIDLIRPFMSDEHRLIQVMVNLLMNAKQAVQGLERADKKIVIYARAMGQSLMISVEDNGIGVKRENLAKIFQSGFTTKTTGHGLGLHSSANQIKILEGEIDCYSAGESQGAIFTVRIPYRTKSRAS